VAPQNRETHGLGRVRRIAEIVRRAYAEFLKLPSIILTAFLMLALGTWFLDHSQPAWLEAARSAMREHFFRSSQSTTDLLATIAGSIITVTSITFSLLLLAVQQAAGALTHQVYDQFLRRRINQIYFAFFVGLAVYTLIILASVDPPYNPVFGAAVALILVVVALMIMILLLYTTINQMRPVVVIDSIHDRILLARERQSGWLSRTRQATAIAGIAPWTIESDKHGYVVGIDIDGLAGTAGTVGDDAEILLHVSIGTYVAYGDNLAELRSTSPAESPDIVNAIRQAIRVEQQRDLDDDPAFGIKQLADIGWTSVSTAKSNPAPGLLVIHSLRDLMARWSSDERPTNRDKTVPVVYRDDVLTELFNAFEILAVVASESMQPHTTSALVRTFAIMFERLPSLYRQRADQAIRRSLSAFGEHVLTSELDQSLLELAQTMKTAGHDETAGRVQQARDTLAASVGKLASRATRVKGGQ
jgi:uncharacterized membrane protein